MLQPSVGSDRFFAITSLFEFNGEIQNIQLRKLAPLSFPPQFSAVRMSP
jgi:hypothetical protein